MAAEIIDRFPLEKQIILTERLRMWADLLTEDELWEASWGKSQKTLEVLADEALQEEQKGILHPMPFPME
jgi:hypothetical protein